MTTFLGIVLILLFIIAVVNFIVVSNNTMYCYVYLHEDWKLWQYFIKGFKFHYEYTIQETLVFIDEYGVYKANVYPNGLCSIHNNYDNSCICCDFNKRLSRKMAKRLMEIYDNERQLLAQNIPQGI